MRKIFTLGIVIGLTTLLQGSEKKQDTGVIWQIGIKDSSAVEFALAPGDYQKFLNEDFGWEDRFFLVGKSNPKEDFPYILPGPDDTWGGTSRTAGIRTHVLNILFRMKSIPDR